jgi:hypothetical protein
MYFLKSLKYKSVLFFRILSPSWKKPFKNILYRTLYIYIYHYSAGAESQNEINHKRKHVDYIDDGDNIDNTLKPYWLKEI